MSWYQKGKTSLNLLEQEIVSGNGISWATDANLYLAQTDNHASIPPLSFFTGWMPFLLPNQQRQSTECILKDTQSNGGTIPGNVFVDYMSYN